MMSVRIVRMSVLERFVYVGVRMRLLPVPARIVLMLMMGVVNMRMFVLQRQVAVAMGMAFGEMQPYSGSHEESGNDQSERQGRAQRYGERSADKRSHRKISARSCGAEISQRQNK